MSRAHGLVIEIGVVTGPTVDGLCTEYFHWFLGLVFEK